jgi:hypothetical protein
MRATINKHWHLVIAAAATSFVACGSSSGSPPPGTKLKVGDDGAEIEVTHTGIRAYVTSNAFRSWVAEPAVRDSTQDSPHGKVRVFFNKASYEALQANRSSLPVGAMIVKDLLQADGVMLAGYAVMVKSTESSWTWWEAFASNLDTPAVFAVDTPTCRGCHSQAGNKDQVRTPIP